MNAGYRNHERLKIAASNVTNEVYFSTCCNIWRTRCFLHQPAQDPVFAAPRLCCCFFWRISTRGAAWMETRSVEHLLHSWHKFLSRKGSFTCSLIISSIKAAVDCDSSQTQITSGFIHPNYFTASVKEDKTPHCPMNAVTLFWSSVSVKHF